MGQDKFNLLKKAKDSAMARQEIITNIARDTLPDFTSDFLKYGIKIEQDLGHLIKGVDWNSLATLSSSLEKPEEPKQGTGMGPGPLASWKGEGGGLQEDLKRTYGLLKGYFEFGRMPQEIEQMGKGLQGLWEYIYRNKRPGTQENNTINSPAQLWLGSRTAK